MQKNISRLAFQFFLDLAQRCCIRAARVEQSDVAMSAHVHVLPAINFHQDIAQIARLRGGKECGDDFLHRQLVRAGENETRRALFQKELLQRRQFLQDRFLNRGRQFAQKTFEPLDDVEEKRLIHRRGFPSPLRFFGANARRGRGARLGKRFQSC